SDKAGTRLNNILDTIGSHAPRNIRAGTRILSRSCMTGQSALDDIRKARDAENVVAHLFIARDGTVTFHDADHPFVIHSKTHHPTRITSITLSTATPAVAEAVFRRDLGDRIRLLRTPPGSGARIDQTLFIHKIEISATPAAPWTIRWGVSPL